MAGLFERCPRVLCENELCIPYGESVEPGKGTIKLYCPRCQEVYNTSNDNKKLDGCAFGPYFANMFILQFPDLPNKHRLDFFPKLHGFKVHESSKNHPLYKYCVEKPSGKPAKIERPTIKYVE